MVEIDLVEVIEGEGYTLEDKGNHYACLCPLHGDTSPSFIIYKNYPHRYICFGCGERGDAIDFIRKLLGLSFAGAVKYLDLKHATSTRVALRNSPIEIIVAEEIRGIDVREKYGKVFIDSLLMKEIIRETNSE